jgi:Poly(A) polymerase catalytic subunit
MEEDINYSKHSLISIKDRIKAVIEQAEERQRYETAHNPDNLKALSVIRAFIKRKGRVCYGGTAMNAILPPEKRFYSEELDLPDYDFFTPDAASDIDEMVRDLLAAGFSEVYHKVGIHEGTKKVMVNFVPVADITVLKKELYEVYHRRAIIKEGIHYTDPDMLRAMMYLELSRPKGMPARWEKVFERLQLINDNFPIKRCAKTIKSEQIPMETARAIYDFVIENQRVLCSAPASIYSQGIRGNAVMRMIKSGAISFTSPTARADAAELKSRIGGAVYLYKAIGDAPERYEIRHDICRYGLSRLLPSAHR